MAIEDLDFGTIFKRKVGSTVIKFKNTTRRRQKWNIAIPKGMEGIFEVDESEGTAGPKEEVIINVRFKPTAAKFYSTQFVVTTEDAGVLPFVVEGQGVEASVNLPNVPEAGLDFGIVGVENAGEFKTFTLENPTDAILKLGLKTDNPDITMEEDEVTLGPGESRDVRILYNPNSRGANTSATLKVYNIDFDKGVEPEELYSTEIKGIGGDFLMGVKRITKEMSDDIVDVSDTGSKERISVNVTIPKIYFEQKVKKAIELENNGDTFVEFEVIGPVINGETEPYTGQDITSVGGNAVLVIEPLDPILPHSSNKLAFSLRVSSP
jgi:hypothetical protein